MGMRLIDADAFDKTLIEAQAKCKKNGGNFRFGVLGEVRANLALFPTVDRPVRCKDCKYWNAEEHDCNIKMGRFACDADFFCADGKHK